MPSTPIDPKHIRNLSMYAKDCVETKPQQSDIVKSTIDKLALQQHPEGGYYVETDRDTLEIENPFINSSPYANASSQEKAKAPTRDAMTTIHYYLTPDRPIGHFHRNKARTVHTLHRGRAMYVIIDPDKIDPMTNKNHTYSFVVGNNIVDGEKLQWIVEGGKWKATYLLPDSDERNESECGLLISETVVPGFEFCDHEFLTEEELHKLLVKEKNGANGVDDLSWLLLKDEKR